MSQNTYSFYNDISILDTTDSTSPTTGALVIRNGGLAVGKSLTLAGIKGAPVYDSGTTAGWYNIGNISGSSGSKAAIKIIGSAGYNSNIATGGETNIHLSLNNNSSATVTNVGSTFYSLGAANNEQPAVADIKLVQNGTDRYSYDVYANLRVYTAHNIHVTGDARMSFTPRLTATTDPGLASATVAPSIEGFQLHSPLFVRNTTDTTVTAGGAIRVAGGIGIEGNIVQSAGKNLIYAGTTVGVPSFSTRSLGTRLALYPLIGAGTTDYAIGIESAHMWSSVEQNVATYGFKWYGGATNIARLDGIGNMYMAGQLNVSSSTQLTANGKLTLLGPAGSPSGPHIHAYVATNTVHPIWQQFNWDADNIAWSAGLYHNGSNWISSHATSNFQIYKINNLLQFFHNTATTAVGSVTPLRAAMTLNTSGVFSILTTTDTTAGGGGAFQVSGGASVTKTLYLGAGSGGSQPIAITISAPSTAVSSTWILDSNNASSSTRWGIFHAGSAGTTNLPNGSLGFFSHTVSSHVLQLRPDGTIFAASTADSTTATSGSLFLAGGLGITKGLSIGVKSTTDIVPGFHMNAYARDNLQMMWDMYDNGTGNAFAANASAYRITKSGGNMNFSGGTGYTIGAIINPPIILQLQGSTGAVIINTTTDSTTTTSGALQVRGGTGITGSLTVGGGALRMTSATSNTILFSNVGVAAPTFTTRSAGTKISLWSDISATSADYAIGIENGGIWNGVPTITQNFKWYGGTTNVMTLHGTGLLRLTSTVVDTNGHFVVDRPNAGGLGGTITIRNSAGGTNASAALAFELDGSTAYNATTGASDANCEIRAINENGGLNNAGALSFSTWNGTAVGERMRIASDGTTTIRAPFYRNFASNPTTTWGHGNNTAYAAGWNFLNSANFPVSSWLPNVSGITWSGTGITIPVSGLWQLHLWCSSGSGQSLTRFIVNTSPTGNGATTTVTNNTNPDSFIIAHSDYSAGIQSDCSAVVALNANTVINPIIFFVSANTPSFISVSITLVQYLS